MIERFIDAHCLVGEDYWLSHNKPALAHYNDLTEYGRTAAAEAKSFQSVIMPFPSSRDGSFLEENENVLRLSKEYPWTIPVLAFNYRSPNNVRYILHALETGVVCGLVVWPIVCDLDLEDMAEDPSFRYLISNCSCWFTIHTGAGNEANIHRVKKINRYCPEDVVRLAASFPSIRFNCSHLLRISKKALDMARTLDNIVIDISGISTHLRWYEYDQNVFPAPDAGTFAQMESAEILRRLMNDPALCDKLVFGSQYPFGKWYGFDLSDELALVRQVGLPREQKDKLLYRNFENFLRKTGKPQ